MALAQARAGIWGHANAKMIDVMNRQKMIKMDAVFWLICQLENKRPLCYYI